MALVFPILTQFDDRAAKKADKTFGALGKKFAQLFSVATAVKFGKESVKAFMEAEKEAAQLRAQLEAINLGFAAPFLDEYIDNLELLTGIAGNRLNSAFISLSQATNDATTAQKLLNVALDISAATGKDLNTITNALQRGYKGELTALARLRIGYTTADLKARDFDDVLTELSDKFQGSSAKAADTLAGKMARLAGATDQAKEAFGAGFVKGLENSNVAVEDLQKQVIGLGDAFGYVAGEATGFYSTLVTDVTNALQESDSLFAKAVKSLVKNQAEASRLENERGRASLRARNNLLKAEKKITAERKKQIDQIAKDKANTEKLAKAKTVFDMEQIQIQAALQGKITAEEKLRLQLMQAIIDENAAKAAKLTADLAKAQADTKLLAESMSKFVASDPFAFWSTYFATQKKERDDLDKDLNAFDANDPFSFWGAYWAMQKKERDALDKDIKDIKGGDPFAEYPDLFKTQKDAAADLDKDIKDIKAGDPFPGWDDYIAARIAGVQALKAELASLSAAQALAQQAPEVIAEDATSATEELLQQAPEVIAEDATSATEEIVKVAEDATIAITDSIKEAETVITYATDLGLFPDFTLPGLEEINLSGLDILSSLQPFGGVNLSVNVEGSIISQEDFTAAILRELYKLQDQGVPLVTSSTAIGG